VILTFSPHACSAPSSPRSGVIASVHAFSQGAIGIFFLSFLTLVVPLGAGAAGLALERSGAQGDLDSIVSRESAFLLNNVLLVAADVHRSSSAPSSRSCRRR
jgi:cytochrome c biogenesis factor